jgi:hypothetical protein
MLLVKSDFLHNINAIPEKGFRVLLFCGTSKHISQAHCGQQWIHHLFEASQIQQNLSKLSGLFMGQARG